MNKHFKIINILRSFEKFRALNRRAITLVEAFLYVLFFIIIILMLSSMFKTVLVKSIMESNAIKFNTEKNQIYAIINKHAGMIDEGSLKVESNPAPEISAHVTNDYDYYYDVLQYSTTYKEDNEGQITTYKTNVRFEETDEGLVYKFTNTRILPDGTTETDEEMEQTFRTINDVKFSLIDKICTESTIDYGCIKVDNLVDVLLYSEYDVLGTLSINKSKRTFYFEVH